MKLSRLAIALYMGIVFASGGVLGWFGQRTYHETTVGQKQAAKDPQEFRRRVIAETERRLKLTSDQVMKYTIILDDTKALQDALYQRHMKEYFADPERQKIRETQIERMKGMLDSQQQGEYEQMRKERELERQQQKKDGSGKRGPGF
ncbi:MAG TPA: hypothetical protein VGN17_26395 [Bryobacteraceae bacterium]|jgi:hypothetical protein